MKKGQYRLYIGTYTRGTNSDGIYTAVFDPKSGVVSELKTAAQTVNPSFLAIDPSGTSLYSVTEASEVDGKGGGALCAYRIDSKSGDLEFQNRVSTGGPGPCHVAVDAAGELVAAANYGGGSVALFKRNVDGRLSEHTAFAQHRGRGPHETRQQGPHAHSANFTPSGNYLLVPDLGIDTVVRYKINRAKGTIKAVDREPITVDPAAGPRHLAFHPNGRFLYVVNELASTVTAFELDADDGAVRNATVSALPADFAGESTAADIHVTPDGNFLYSSNRGHDSIAVFRVDQASGELSPVGHIASGGEVPRNFALDPSGRFLLAANQGSDNVVVFAIDPQSGVLTRTGVTVSVPSPVCVVFLTPATA